MCLVNAYKLLKMRALCNADVCVVIGVDAADFSFCNFSITICHVQCYGMPYDRTLAQFPYSAQNRNLSLRAPHAHGWCKSTIGFQNLSVL